MPHVDERRPDSENQRGARQQRPDEESVQLWRRQVRVNHVRLEPADLGDERREDRYHAARAAAERNHGNAAALELEAERTGVVRAHDADLPAARIEAGGEVHELPFGASDIERTNQKENSPPHPRCARSETRLRTWNMMKLMSSVRRNDPLSFRMCSDSMTATLEAIRNRYVLPVFR